VLTDQTWKHDCKCCGIVREHFVARLLVRLQEMTIENSPSVWKRTDRLGEVRLHGVKSSRFAAILK
jgi:hypothetical protein